jgi:hypothetical protein
MRDKKRIAPRRSTTQSRGRTAQQAVAKPPHRLLQNEELEETSFDFNKMSESRRYAIFENQAESMM